MSLIASATALLKRPWIDTRDTFIIVDPNIEPAVLAALRDEPVQDLIHSRAEIEKFVRFNYGFKTVLMRLRSTEVMYKATNGKDITIWCQGWLRRPLDLPTHLHEFGRSAYISAS